MALPNTQLVVSRLLTGGQGSFALAGQAAGLNYSTGVLDGSESDGTTILQNYGIDLPSSGYFGAINGTWASGVVSPSGATNSSTLVENSASAAHFTYITHSFTVTVPANGFVTATIYAKTQGRRYLIIRLTDGADANGFAACFDLQTGTYTGTSQSIGTGTFNSASVAVGANAFFKLSARGTISNVSGSGFFLWYSMNSAVTANPGANYLGDGTSGITLWRPKVIQS